MEIKHFCYCFAFILVSGINSLLDLNSSPPTLAHPASLRCANTLTYKILVFVFMGVQKPPLYARRAAVCLSCCDGGLQTPGQALGDLGVPHQTEAHQEGY